MREDANENIVELIDENNQLKKFELIEIIEHEDSEYAILAPVDEDADEAIVCEIRDEGTEMLFKPVDDMDLLNIIEQLYNEMN